MKREEAVFLAPATWGVTVGGDQELNVISVVRGERSVYIEPSEKIIKAAKIAVGKKSFIKHINRARLCLQACACI